MYSISQIAERDGVSKQAASKAVKKLLEDRPETPVEFGTKGQVLRVSVSHYDAHRQRFTNPAKVKAAVQPRAPGAGRTAGKQTDIDDAETFGEARRTKEWLAVRRERMRQQEDAGNLLRKDMVSESADQSGVQIQSVLKRLPNRADDLAVAVSKEGVHGARVLLRQIAFEMGNEIADALQALAGASPRTDALIEDDLG